MKFGCNSMAHSLYMSCHGSVNPTARMTCRNRCILLSATKVLACYMFVFVGDMCEQFASIYSRYDSTVEHALFGLQGIAASILHAPIGKLHEEYGVYKDRLGVASPATLQCLCNLAQGYCLQGNLSNAEEQLQKALGLLSPPIDERPVAVEVLRIRIMLELADVTVQLDR